ncbi:hypothetical protein DsansV1_C15g0132701 [Dioscorea sansibarensis]
MWIAGFIWLPVTKAAEIGAFISLPMKAVSKCGTPDLVDFNGVTTAFMSIPSFESMHYSGDTPCTHHPSRQPILLLFTP